MRKPNGRQHYTASQLKVMRKAAQRRYYVKNRAYHLQRNREYYANLRAMCPTAQTQP